jgi:hypothetical protein
LLFQAHHFVEQDRRFQEPQRPSPVKATLSLDARRLSHGKAPLSQEQERRFEDSQHRFEDSQRRFEDSQRRSLL